MAFRQPDHKLFETHPIINSQMLYCMGHGQILPKPDIAELGGDQIQFIDGTSESIDVLIYATGYRITFPFIDQRVSKLARRPAQLVSECLPSDR